jgi:hypothetical protein
MKMSKTRCKMTRYTVTVEIISNNGEYRKYHPNFCSYDPEKYLETYKKRIIREWAYVGCYVSVKFYDLKER